MVFMSIGFICFGVLLLMVSLFVLKMLIDAFHLNMLGHAMRFLSIAGVCIACYLIVYGLGCLVVVYSFI